MSVSRVQTNLRRLLAVCALLLAIGFASFVAARTGTGQKGSRPAPRLLSKAGVLAAYGKLPLVFEKNLGQTDSRVKFLAHAGGYTLFLTDREAVLRLRASKVATNKERPGSVGRSAGGQSSDGAVVRLALSGPSSPAQVEGVEEQAGHSNYLIGNDPSRWQRNVPLYGRVKYHDVYPGIDAIYYGNQSRLETDYIVAPGADPSRISLRIRGGKKVSLNSQGDLVIASASGDLMLRRPNVYQEIDGKRREIAANYVQRSGRTVGVEIGSYDSQKPLVVDPVVVYSTYLGGATPTSGNATSSAAGVAVDSSGNAYVAGQTDTTDFPTTPGVYQGKNNGGGFEGNNAFIAKLNPTGTSLTYSTYLGGSVSDGAVGIGIDASGNAYVTGTTTSTDFPIANASAAIQPVAPTKINLGAPSGFFAELDPNGVNLLYSTYLGGNGRDTPAGIAVLLAAPDGNPNAYIVGSTTSINFPFTPNALQTTNKTASSTGSSDNVFVSQIDPLKSGLSALIYSTYLGGSVNDTGSAIAVDANSNVYITGSAGSFDFPTSKNAFQSSLLGSADAFVARIDTVNSALVYSTFLGAGSPGPETGNCIAVDSNFKAFVGGHTYDTSFPVTTGALETMFPGVTGIGTGFVAQLDTAQSLSSSTLVYATYLGGRTSGDQPHAIAIDSADNAYLTGETWSDNFPVTPGAPYPTGAGGLQHGFVSVLNANGSKLIFSTFYGTGGAGNGINTAAGLGLALDRASSPDVFIVGATTSSTFPITPGVVQTTLNGLQDAFVAELSPAAAQGVFATPSSLSFGNQPKGTTSSPQTVTLANNTQAAITITGSGFTITGTNASDFAIQTNNCPAVGATLAADTSCTLMIAFTPSTTSSETATLRIFDSGGGSPQIVTLAGTGTTPPPGVTLTPSSANFGSVSQGQTSSPQTFTLSNNSTGAITISGSGFTITGTNAGDFKIQTNNCPAVGATLAAKSACTLAVVFKPSTTSSESATLSAFDSDSSSPQTASLSGAGTGPSGSVTLAPASLSFGNVNINTTSAAQTVTLTNSKTTSLTINSVTIAGPNASDFAAASKCSGTLAASANCTISVTFTPTTGAAESATLSVSDSDSTSPQTVALSGTGVAAKPDFTISASPTAATVSAPGSVGTTVAVTSVAGFSSAVTLSCSSLPGDAVCAFSQNPVTPAANGSVSSTVTISTSVGVITGATPAYSTRWPRPPAWIWVFAGLGVALAGMRTEKRAFKRATCAFALLSFAALAGCTGTPSTPTGTYAVHLTGQTASANHSFKFMLTVK